MPKKQKIEKLDADKDGRIDGTNCDINDCSSCIHELECEQSHGIKGGLAK